MLQTVRDTINASEAIGLIVWNLWRARTYALERSEDLEKKRDGAEDIKARNRSISKQLVALIVSYVFPKFIHYVISFCDIKEICLILIK